MNVPEAILRHEGAEKVLADCNQTWIFNDFDLLLPSQEASVALPPDG